MTDTNIATAKPAKAPKPEMTEAEISAFAKDAAAQAVFNRIGELGSQAGTGLDSQPALAIEVANAIGNGSIAYQSKSTGRGAKKNVFDAITAKYVTERQHAASRGAKGESSAALVSRIQKIGEAAHVVKELPDNNRGFVDVLQDAIAHRLGRKDEKGIRTPFEFLYQIAQEQVRRENGKAVHSLPLSEEEYSGLLTKPKADDPELRNVVKGLYENLEALIKDEYRGHTVLAELSDGSDNPLYSLVLKARNSMFDALDMLEQEQNATKAAADAKAKAEADAAVVAKAEDERKAKIASLSEDDAMAQFMAEWKAARGIVETAPAERKPAKGRKAA